MVTRLGRDVMLRRWYRAADRRHVGICHLRDRLTGFDRPTIFAMGFAGAGAGSVVFRPASAAP